MPDGNCLCSTVDAAHPTLYVDIASLKVNCNDIALADVQSSIRLFGD